MTEEIIIDGVDVAECCCYENSKCLWTKRYYENNVVPVCEKVKDCYYKQLKRLEQENENIINEYNKLQAEIIGDMEFKEIMLTGITPLKVLQNLKERNRELQAFYDVHESFKTDFDANRKLLDKYRSALEEINKIAEPRFVNGLNEEADQYNQCMDRIQDKINEVLNDN